MFPLGVIYSSEVIGNFERNEAFSVETWFYQTSAKSSVLVSHMEDAPLNRRGWLCNVWMGRNVGMVLCSHEGNGNFIHVRTASGQYSFNTWNHIIFTYNGNSLASGIKIYLNGVSKSFSVIADNLTDTIKTTHKMWIGDSYTYRYFPGRIDEVVIYDRALTKAEVTQRYNSGNGTETLFGPAYLQYKLNEASGIAVSDSSGNNRHGKTIGAPIWISGKLNNCIQLNGSTQKIEA